MNKKVKLCIVITASSHLLALYREQFKYFQKNGFEITAIASSGVEHDKLKEECDELIILLRLTYISITTLLKEKLWIEEENSETKKKIET